MILSNKLTKITKFHSMLTNRHESQDKINSKLLKIKVSREKLKPCTACVIAKTKRKLLNQIKSRVGCINTKKS